MDFTCLFFGVLFSVSGILFALEKGHVHLAAWKRMPPEEKEKINIRPLCRNIGAMILLSGVIFLLKGLWPEFKNRWFVFVMITWLILAGLDSWYITKSNRYYSR